MEGDRITDTDVDSREWPLHSEGRLPGSLAERHDAHQHGAA